MLSKIKILTFFLLFSFSFNQNMGILKTNKNKSGLGIFVTSNFLYKGNNVGQNIREIPERYKLQITYSSKLNFDFSIGAGEGEVKMNESDKNEKFYTNTVGFGYHFYKKKWGSSIEIKKSKWFSSDPVLKNDNMQLGFTLYSKTKYHPYFSFVNVFFDENQVHSQQNNNIEIITFGGMRQINDFIKDPFGRDYSVIVHWGFNILLEENNFRILKDNASFFLGLGLEFF